MLGNGDNNPRVFAETITLDSWRTAFDGKKGEAELHIDVAFAPHGRVGGTDAPVRFRLSLKRAEVHVIEDTEQIVKIKSETVMRAELPKPIKKRRRVEKTAVVGAKAGVQVSTSKVRPEMMTGLDGSIKVSEKLESVDLKSRLEVHHWKAEHGYAFRISSSKGALNGQPWAAKTCLLKLRDSKWQRKRGEPPEVRVEIRCMREDLIIEKKQFTDEFYPFWRKLPHLKRIAVEQF